MKHPRRWSDQDSHFGPFTWSRESYSSWAVELSSGDADDSGCYWRFTLGKRTLIMELPPILRPSAFGVPRKYSLTLVEGTLHACYGLQTMDRSTEQSKCWFLPWTQWQFYRLSLYDLFGKHYWTQLEHELAHEADKWRIREKAEAQCPAATFKFLDFDSEPLEARTHIEEREWHFGTGSFRWLRWFRAPRVKRELEIRFSGETGSRKGSWKGGTVACSIPMLPGELHREAFVRYCAEHNMTLVES